MRFEPRQLARDQRDLNVDLPLGEFARLGELIVGLEEPVSVRAGFRRDEAGRIRVQGHIRTRIRMNCGNCGEVEAFDQELPIDLCLVASEEAARALVDELEPVVMGSVEATPAELFEDDLILALPDRPCRGRLDCPHRPRLPVDEVAEADAPQEKKDSPFAVLARLKSEDDVR